MLEALGLDAAAVIFALLALAQARLGRPALTERILNLACVGGSLAMNALSATLSDLKSVVAWVLPALLYAAASDRLIAVVRRRALARTPTADTDPGAERSAYAALGGAALWLLRLALAPPSTVIGFRHWVITTAPIAPGLRPAMPTQPNHTPAPGGQPQRRHTEAGESDRDIRAASAPAAPAAGPGQADPAGRAAPSSVPSSPPAPVHFQPLNHSDPAARPGGPSAGPSLTAQTGPANGSPLGVASRTPSRRHNGAGSGAGGASGGLSKRAALIRLYDEAGAAGDPRHHTREGVGPMAKELHHHAGLAQRSTARSYLHDLLDERGIPRRSTDGGSTVRSRTSTGRT